MNLVRRLQPVRQGILSHCYSSSKGKSPCTKTGSTNPKCPAKGKNTDKGCMESNAKKVCGSKEKEKKPDDKLKKVKVTLINGEGVGPELAKAVQQVFCAAKVPVEWEIFDRHIKEKSNDVEPKLIESLMKNKYGIACPIRNPRWEKQFSKLCETYAFVAVCQSLEGYTTPYKQLDCLVIRDQTEGEYSGIEHRVVPGVIQTIKLTTEKSSKRLAEYVFRFAKEKGRKKITVAHKANIMQLTDGSFLEAMRAVSIQHCNDMLFEERYLDTACLNLIMNPESNDVLVSSSMYGDVLILMGASIVGALSLCPCFSVSNKSNIYHCLNEVSEKTAGKDLVNPIGILLSSVIMLRDMKLDEHACKIESAIKNAIKQGPDCLPNDLGGKAKCSEFTEAICKSIEDK